MIPEEFKSMTSLQQAIAAAESLEAEAAAILTRDLGITHPQRLVECLVSAAVLRVAQAHSSAPEGDPNVW